jgi:hypothetical protein
MEDLAEALVLVVLGIIAVGFVIRRRRARRANQTRVESALRARTFDRCGGMLSATGTSSWRPPATFSPSAGWRCPGRGGQGGRPEGGYRLPALPPPGRAPPPGLRRTALLPRDDDRDAGQRTAEFTAAAAPDAWRRYLAIVLDGMRARPDYVTEPLDQPPLEDQQLYACMDGWKDGFWKTPRQRSSPA